MADLESLREQLESELTAAFTGDEAREFREALEDSFPDNVASAFEDCAEGSGPGSSFQECVEQVAEENGLSGDASAAFDSNVPDGVMNALLNVGTQWSADQRQAVRDVATSNNLDELNRDCARGNYQDVKSSLGVDQTPTNFQDCVQMVSDAKDIRGDLKSLWGTD